ncbi:hypothetical protein IJ182_08465 [bacterium]|nr:hypothetical protein [bacterium]
MEIKGLFNNRFQTNDNTVFGDKTNTTNPISVFSVLNKCIEKADTNADGKLSEEEISIFTSKSQVSILSDLGEEIGDKLNEIDPNILKDIINVVKSYVSKDAEFSQDATELNGMSKEDFIQNATNAQEDENASDFWKLIGTDDAENIFNTIDSDGDGNLSEEEIAALAGKDGDVDSISLSDLSNFFKTDAEGLGATTPSETPVQQAEEPSGTDSGAPSGSYNGGGDYQPSVDSVPEQKRTVEQIDTEIQEQETKRTEAKETANQAIAEQQALIDQAVKDSELSDEFKSEYESENTRLSGLITEKDNAINEQNKLVQDYTAEAQSYTSSISDIASQITTMQGEKAQLDPSKDAEKIADYETKIRNLETKKAEFEAAKTAAEEKANEAKQQAETLTVEKDKLVEEKDKILDTLAEKYTDDKEKVAELKTQIAEYQSKISEIRTNLDRDLATIDSNIQTLKNEKAQLAQSEKTQAILNENRVKPDTSLFNVSASDLANMTQEELQNYWKSLGYDAEMGIKLANMTIEETKHVNGAHQCLRAVRIAFEKYYGEKVLDPEITQSRAGNCLGIMQKREDYREITGLTPEQAAKYLPAGTVVVWEGTNNNNDDVVKKCGHICVLDGKGNEAAGNRYASMYKHVGINKPHYFIPVG